MSTHPEIEELRKTPVYNALMRERLTFGIDSDIAESIIVVCLFFIVSPLHFYYFIGVGVFSWFLVLLYAGDDPRALKVLMKYVKQGDLYEPFPHSNQTRNLRPAGFGRMELC
jgi:type IV secretory pathway VirB3-like protein